MSGMFFGHAPKPSHAMAKKNMNEFSEKEGELGDRSNELVVWQGDAESRSSSSRSVLSRRKRMTFFQKK